MTGAMYAAISGLKTHMSALNVIGNNISNVNTLGYKATRYTFNEALYTTVRSGSNGSNQAGGRNPAQIGYGCSVGTMDLDMSTKNYNPTGNDLDCMIDGDGFFVVGEDKTKTGVTGQSDLQGMYLSRLGNLTFDANGYLVDGNGSLVYGFLRMTSVDEIADELELTEEEVYQIQEEQITSPILTPIRLPMVTIESATATDEDTGVVSSMTETIVHWPTSTGNSVEDAVVAGASRLQPNSVSIDEKTGCITAMTKDETLVVVGYLALASVDSPNGVTHVDGRYYQALGGAGNVHLGSLGGVFNYVPNAADVEYAIDISGLENELNLGESDITVESAGGTKLITGGLESSGTDLATEISNMIVIQRGYQANNRIVTVTDSMLEELVNMKR